MRAIKIKHEYDSILETFNKIKTNIDLMYSNNEKISVAVTSPAESDGKTFVACNLASAMAASGRRTLLIDADLRHPTVQEMFDVANSRGLTDILIKGVDWREVIVSTNIPNLYLISSGISHLTPMRLFSSPRLKSLIEDVKGKFDYIVLDTPPVLPVPDVQIISPHLDCVLIVVRYAKTKLYELSKTISALSKANDKITVLINDMKSARKDTYYCKQSTNRN